MTITIPDLETSNQFSLNGDLSGYDSYRLKLVSRYSNREVEPNGFFDWLFECVIVQSNERYTEFHLHDFFPVPITGAYEGLYDYELLGSHLALTPTDPFDPSEWSTLDAGLLKVVLTSTTEMDNLQNYKKYVSPNENGESYVIY